MFTKGKTTFLAIIAFSMALTVNAFAAESRAEAEAPISRQRAQQIALEQVSGGRIVEAEFNDRWFRDDDYEFVVVDDAHRYTISVDAKTGEVIDVKEDRVFEDNLSNTERARLNTGVGAAAVGAGTAASRAASATRNAVVNADNAMDRAARNAAVSADNAMDRAASATRNAAVSADRALDNAASATRNAVVSAENSVDRAARNAAVSADKAMDKAANATRNAAVSADRAVTKAANATRNAALGTTDAAGISRAGGITPERARAIAMDRSPSASIVSMERDMEDDQPIYEIEMKSSTKQIDLKLDAMSGRVISYNEEQLDPEDRVDNVRPLKSALDVR